MMKRVSHIYLVIVMLFSCMLYVDASCTKDEIALLKEEASNIKITYKHLGGVVNDEFTDYSQFQLTVKNINDDFDVYFSDIEKLTVDDGTAKISLSNGNWSLVVYSNKCQTKIDTINFTIPKFNIYSLDPLCEGIDGDDFELCGKYYEYDVSYEDFVKRVNSYRSLHVNDEDNDEENNYSDIVDVLVNFYNTYKMYIYVAVLVIILVIICVAIINKRRKRGVLE